MNKQNPKVKQLIPVNDLDIEKLDIPLGHYLVPRTILAIALTEDGQVLPVYQDSEGYPVVYTRERYQLDLWRDWWLFDKEARAYLEKTIWRNEKEE